MSDHLIINLIAAAVFLIGVIIGASAIVFGERCLNGLAATLILVGIIVFVGGNIYYA